MRQYHRLSKENQANPSTSKQNREIAFWERWDRSAGSGGGPEGYRDHTGPLARNRTRFRTQMMLGHEDPASSGASGAMCVL